MQTQRRQKGFTLVELLVVIAILAILATVSIIGYTQFIKRANMSADQQAVTQMNTLLEGLDVNNEPDDVVDLWTYLNETGLDAEDYKPLSKDHYFFWDQSLNRILLVDKDNKVVFPEAYAEAGKSNSKEWYTLSGTIHLGKKPVVGDNGGVEIASASDFIQTMADNAAGVSSMKLKGDVNMMGASHGSVTLNGNFTLDGDLDGDLGEKKATVSNLVSTEYATVGTTGIYVNKQYGSGLFGEIGVSTSGAPAINVVINDVVFDGFVIGDYETGSTGIIAGIIHQNAIVELQNVTFKNCTVYGLNKAGLIAGQIKGKLILKNVKIENSVVNASEGESGRVFGTVMTSGTIDNQGCSIDDNTVLNIVKYSIHEFVNIGGVEYVTRVKFNTGVPTTATHTITIEGEPHTYTIVYQKGTSSTIGWFKPTSAYAKVSNSDYCGSGINEIIQVIDIGEL